MSKEYEFDLLNDVKLPSSIAQVLGKDILEKGIFKTNVMKVCDYLKALGHKINNVLDYADDGEDNDSQPELTEIVNDVVTKGKKAKKEIKETLDKVEDIVEDVIELKEEIKEDIEEVVEDIVDIKEEIIALLEKSLVEFRKANIVPLEKLILTKADSTKLKKEYIDPLNKKLNKNATNISANVNALAILSNRITDLEKAQKEVTPEVTKEVPAEEPQVEVVVEEVIEIPDVPEEKPSLEEQAEEIDLTAVDQEKLDQIKDLSEKGLE